MQNRIIAFCYLYIGGIIAAMLLPLDPGWLPWLRIAAGLTLVPAGALVLWSLAEKTGATRRVRVLLFLLCSGALLLGYTRYISAHTVPDMRVGEIQIDGDSRLFHQAAALTDTSRLRLRKASPLEEDVRIRIIGELDARQPVRDADGHSRMDAEGRWMFNVIRMPIRSEEIILRSEDPLDTDYVIEQPFNRITGIEWLSGPRRGQLHVYRISNHIGSFVRPGRAQSPVTVLGRITSDPRVYDFKTVLIFTPVFVQYPAGGPFYRVEGGDLQVTVPPSVDTYPVIARTEAYGMDLALHGELTVARAEANPGGFNARQFMRNYNIYGLMNLYQPRDGDSPLIVISPEGAAPRTGHPLVGFSLDLRDRLLRLFKATMPYPQSAFLGGVTLGLRYGLQGAQFPGEEERSPWLTRIGLGRAESTIVDDFRASGVNHVLAVSGLHVTILTAMFIAVFSMLRLPRQIFVPGVIMALVIFAIITGARPSTLRAVIMNSLFLLTWAYLGKGLLSSVMIGVPVAAFIILLHNPLVVVDPSFTLSFGAILSLALITMPVHEILCRLRGNQFLVVMVLTLLTMVIGIRSWFLLITPSFLFPWLGLCVVLTWLGGRLQDKGIGLPRTFAFSALPEPVSTFLAAQVAIQIGMMIPLSAFYFCRWPFGGAVANLIAIPLIGVVVQLGAIAGLLGLIPVVGPFIALVLNAANWVFATFFLWLAHVSALVFPYPFVRRPLVLEVVVYYIFIAGFIWHKPLWAWLKRVAVARGWHERRAPVAMALSLGVVALLPLTVGPPRVDRPDGLHVTVLSVGYGSAVLVETPGGRKVLIDTGFVEHERGRRNEADRTILPFLSHRGIGSLDAVVLTSPLPERAAGTAHLLNHIRAGVLVVPPGLGRVAAGMSEDQLVQGATLGRRPVDLPGERLQRMHADWAGNPEWPRRPALAAVIADRGPTPLNRWAGRAMTVREVAAGDVLFEEPGKVPFRIEVLSPSSEVPGEHVLENGGLVLRLVHGDAAMLLTGPLHYEGQRMLAASGAEGSIRAQVMLAPLHGAAIPGNRDRPPRDTVERELNRATRPLLQAVQPEAIVLEFGSPRPVLGDLGRAAVGVHELTRRFYTEAYGEDAVLSTDRDLAIMLHSNGAAWTIDTQALRNQARGGEEDAVSDLAVGL